MQEHCARRYLAQQALNRMAVMVKSDVNQLPYHLQAIIGALTYAKAEVLWYFRNINEASTLPSGHRSKFETLYLWIDPQLDAWCLVYVVQRQLLEQLQCCRSCQPGCCRHCRLSH